MAGQKELERLRAEIEEVNQGLLRLFCRRGALVREILALKSRHGLPLHMPDREAEMLAALEEQNPGPYSRGAVRRLFRAVFDASQELIERQRGK